MRLEMSQTFGKVDNEINRIIVCLLMWLMRLIE